MLFSTLREHRRIQLALQLGNHTLRSRPIDRSLTGQAVLSEFNGSLIIGEFRRSIGHPSDRDLNIKNQCERILETRELSPKVRRFLEGVIRNADASIDNDLKGDEEMFGD